jgi:hypothetical protein
MEGDIAEIIISPGLVGIGENAGKAGGQPFQGGGFAGKASKGQEQATKEKK